MSEQDACVQTEPISLTEFLPKRSTTLRDVLLPGSSITTNDIDHAMNKSYVHAETQTFVRRHTKGTQTDENDSRFHNLQKSILLYQSSRVAGTHKSLIRLKANHKLSTELLLERKDVESGASVTARIHPNHIRRLKDEAMLSVSQDYLNRLTQSNESVVGMYDPANTLPVKTKILTNSLRFVVSVKVQELGKHVDGFCFPH